MTNQYNNYIPVQDLPTEVPGLIITENISQTVNASKDPDTNPTDTISESVTVTLT